MGANVFANGREVSARKSSNQSIAAMPDVCLSPPSPPAGPLPIPYPNFSNASDTSNGTKTVKIGGDEAGMKDQSDYKTSKGDQAATRSFGMGTVTHTLQGKTQFAAWSSDVMFEGANAVRFMDLTTHNHASPPENSCSRTASTGEPAPAEEGDIGNPCPELEKRMQNIMTNEMSGPNTLQSDEALATGSHSTLGWMKAGAQAMERNRRIPVATPANGWSPRPPMVNRQEPLIACSQTKRYSGYAHGGAHAEGKILNDIYGQLQQKGLSMAGTQLTLRIHWNNKGVMRYEPCPPCKNAICITAQECEMDIYICEKKGDGWERKKAPCKDGQWKAPRPPRAGV